jgi:integrase
MSCLLRSCENVDIYRRQRRTPERVGTVCPGTGPSHDQLEVIGRLDQLGERRSPHPPAPLATVEQHPSLRRVIFHRGHTATDHGAGARGLILVLWRAGLRIQERLGLNELDLDRRRGSVLVRRTKAAAVARSA